MFRVCVSNCDLESLSCGREMLVGHTFGKIIIRLYVISNLFSVLTCQIVIIKFIFVSFDYKPNLLCSQSTPEFWCLFLNFCVKSSVSNLRPKISAFWKAVRDRYPICFNAWNPLERFATSSPNTGFLCGQLSHVCTYPRSVSRAKGPAWSSLATAALSPVFPKNVLAPLCFHSKRLTTNCHSDLSLILYSWRFWHRNHMRPNFTSASRQDLKSHLRPGARFYRRLLSIN